jgi:hypothetical protein
MLVTRISCSKISKSRPSCLWTILKKEHCNCFGFLKWLYGWISEFSGIKLRVKLNCRMIKIDNSQNIN